ncbi:MAG TPA: ROK family protein, partial [Acidimicrobiales bacterium]|nr:ROK family protein [Acidimicrobiales bacterium]
GEDVAADSKMPTPGTGGADIAAAIAAIVQKMGLDGVERIGIGAPGVIDRERGAVLAAPNLAISSSVPLTELVADAVGIDRDAVRLDNDVNAATLAEHRLGAAMGARDALCVFVGTGVGGGLVLDGELRRGARGLTGEIGHVVVRDGGRRCGCGGFGHLEAYAGRRRLEETARELHEAGRETALVRIAGDGRMKSSVFDKALAEGDAVAVELLDEAIEALGAALASAVALVDLEVIVLGGGLAGRLGEPFTERVRDAVQRRLFVPTLPLEVRSAALGDLGGAVGAALLWSSPS